MRVQIAVLKRTDFLPICGRSVRGESTFTCTHAKQHNDDYMPDCNIFAVRSESKD